MRYFRGYPPGAWAVVMLCIIIIGCAQSLPPDRSTVHPRTVTSHSSPPLAAPPKTLAIFNFENNSVTDSAQYAPLSKGIPAILITELSHAGPSLKLIERSKIASLLKETALTQSGGVDESTAIQAGKILGAEAIAFGSFIVLGPQVRIDTRIIGVETSEVIMAESITGDSRNFMTLIGRLGAKIAGSLNARTGPSSGGKGGDIQAAVLFSRGVDAWDRGERQRAKGLFDQAISRDPTYRDKVASIRASAPAAPVSGPSRPSEKKAELPPDTPDTKTVEAEGMSFISRADAIRQAQRAAVEQAMGVFVQSLTEVEDYEVKKESIFSRSEGYITRYRVIKELAADDQYIVGIRAQVSLSKIKDDLVAMKILLDSMDRPTVMVLMEEHYPAAIPADMALAETEMVRYLKERGFDLVDPAQIERIQSVNAAKAALSGNPDAAKQLGLRMGAQYVIVGKAAVQDIGEAYAGSGLRSLQATLQARIIQSQTGSILGSTVKSGAAAHASPLAGASMALSKAARKAGDEYLVDTITDSFQDFLNNGIPIQVYVNHVTTFRESTAITDRLSELDDAVDVKKEGWSRAGGLLILNVLFKGTGETLARTLDGVTVSGRSLEVVDVAASRVECSLR